MLLIVLTYLGVGAVAGILAGLFGIGGGLVIVPMLVFCFTRQQLAAEVIMDEASEIVFCADGGKGIWPRIDNLISELGLRNAKRILDYGPVQ